jgi:DNA polymerase III delta subunit
LGGSDRRGGARGAVDADSTERLAAEYRKLAALAGTAAIERDLVEAQVEDRGEQDVWAILDAIGSGRAGEALAALERRLAGSEDPIADRLGFFKLLADFARQMVAVDGLVTATGSERGVGSYPRFKERVAPRLQDEIEGLAKNPVAKLHPFRLHRAYLAASRFAPGELDRLPAFVLETELRLKGDSGDPDAALADLVVRLGAPRRR